MGPRHRDIPTYHSFDRRIADLKGQTFVTALRDAATQQCKPRRPLCPEAKMLEDVRLQASLRRELSFFREVYSAVVTLQERLCQLRQELILNYYIRPMDSGEADREWLTTAESLDEILQDYHDRAELAEQNWFALEGAQCAIQGQAFV